MKNIKLFSIDMLIIVLCGLLIGLSVGLYCPDIKIKFQTVYNNVYIKFHPESQMDTRTIIMNRATKNSIKIPQKDIFETPENKENAIILFIKRIFKSEKEEKPLSILDENID